MGNRVTAERWAAHLDASEHTVEISEDFAGQDSAGQGCDLLIALHAVRSASAMERFRKRHPKTPIILILTGTDLYGALPDDPVALASLQLATILVVLNPLGANRLPEHVHDRVRTVVQSVTLEHDLASEDTPGFQICVVGHLRPVKDPFLAAHALRQLPKTSKASLIHLGKALDKQMCLQAETEQRENPRYTWLGERPQLEVLQHMKNSRLHVLTSKMEGGANALCEAIALGVPTLATRIDGSVGILGEDYPGFFSVGDAGALAQLIERTELDPEFLDTLREHCLSLQAMVQPAAERAKIDSIIDELRD